MGMNERLKKYGFLFQVEVEYMPGIGPLEPLLRPGEELQKQREALHMTQPPLSYQMKMLEEELEVQLFLRGTKKITLTEAGAALYERAGSLLKMADITKREVFKAGTAATIHIGMTPSSVSMMSEYLARFAQKFPEVHFDIHEGSTFTLKDQLENRVVDITTLRTPIMLKGCETRSLAQEKLLVMALPTHELSLIHI